MRQHRPGRMTYEELQPKIEAILKVEGNLYEVTTAHLLCRDEVGHGVRSVLPMARFGWRKLYFMGSLTEFRFPPPQPDPVMGNVDFVHALAGTR